VLPSSLPSISHLDHLSESAHLVLAHHHHHYHLCRLSLSRLFSSPLVASLLLAEFSEIPNSGGVKGLDSRVGDGEVPIEGDQIAIHYYGRLAAKQR
ncbi:unnamed protein product, partial [Thlaspi arvense]